jgi:ammonium transporter, Amt family
VVRRDEIYARDPRAKRARSNSAKRWRWRAAAQFKESAMDHATTAELGQQLADTQAALNIVFTMLAGFLIMFMQAGFALVETGLVRGKNAAHTMGMNFLVYAIGILGYWTLGFGLQMGGFGALSTFGGDASLNGELSVVLFGKQHGLLGTTGFMLPPSIFTPAIATMFFFQMVFMDTTCTIPTGALAERWKFMAFIVFSFAISTIIYPVYANWVWGGGFLSALGRNFGLGHGHVDFAGSSVVHMTGGLLALICAKLLGPRRGKYGANGEIHAIPAHNIPMVVTGTFILAFGWFGFNAGSTLAAMDTRFAVVAVNTMLASASGAFAGALYSRYKFGKPDVTLMCNGMLAGLVAITAPCAFVSSAVSLLIGGVAGVLVIEAAIFVERTLRIDDPVGASSVHFVNGAWGILALGLFADGTYGAGFNGVPGHVTGLFYGDGGQLVAELTGMAVNVVYVGGVGALVFTLIGKLMGNRVSAEDELGGLDVAEMGMEGYAMETGRYHSDDESTPVREPHPVSRLPAGVTS